MKRKIFFLNLTLKIFIYTNLNNYNIQSYEFIWLIYFYLNHDEIIQFETKHWLDNIFYYIEILETNCFEEPNLSIHGRTKLENFSRYRDSLSIFLLYIYRKREGGSLIFRGKIKARRLKGIIVGNGANWSDAASKGIGSMRVLFYYFVSRSVSLSILNPLRSSFSFLLFTRLLDSRRIAERLQSIEKENVLN